MERRRAGGRVTLEGLSVAQAGLVPAEGGESLTSGQPTVGMALAAHAIRATLEAGDNCPPLQGERR